MLSWEELDIFSIRGFCGIVRLLEERLKENSNGIPEATQKELQEVSHRFQRIVSGLSERKYVDLGEETLLIQRIDRWFAGGFCNLITFLERRIQSGPPVEDPERSRLIHELSRSNKLIMSLITYSGREKELGHEHDCPNPEGHGSSPTATRIR